MAYALYVAKGGREGVGSLIDINGFHAVDQPGPHGLVFRFEFIIDHQDVRFQQREVAVKLFHAVVLLCLPAGVRVRGIAHSIGHALAFDEIGSPSERLRAIGLAFAIDQHAVVAFGMLIPSGTMGIRHGHFVARAKECSLSAVQHIECVLI